MEHRSICFDFFAVQPFKLLYLLLIQLLFFLCVQLIFRFLEPLWIRVDVLSQARQERHLLLVFPTVRHFGKERYLSFSKLSVDCDSFIF